MACVRATILACQIQTLFPGHAQNKSQKYALYPNPIYCPSGASISSFPSHRDIIILGHNKCVTLATKECVLGAVVAKGVDGVLFEGLRLHGGRRTLKTGDGGGGFFIPGVASIIQLLICPWESVVVVPLEELLRSLPETMGGTVDGP